MPSTYEASSTLQNITAQIPLKRKKTKVCIMNSRCTLCRRRVSELADEMGWVTFLALTMKKREIKCEKDKDYHSNSHTTHTNLLVSGLVATLTQNPCK